MAHAQIFLDSEQLKAVVHSHGPVQVCDPSGNVLGTMTPAAAWLEQQDIIEAKRRLASDGPWHTTKQVFDRLRDLAGQ